MFPISASSHSFARHHHVPIIHAGFGRRRQCSAIIWTYSCSPMDIRWTHILRLVPSYCPEQLWPYCWPWLAGQAQPNDHALGLAVDLLQLEGPGCCVAWRRLTRYHSCPTGTTCHLDTRHNRDSGATSWHADHAVPIFVSLWRTIWTAT
jgi:hypothetical protein